MVRNACGLLGVGLLVLILNPAVWAEESSDLGSPSVGESLESHFEIYLAGGTAYYAMGDLNRDIDRFNVSLKYYGFQTIENLNSGNEFTGGLAYWIFDYLALGVEIGYLTAELDSYPAPEYHYHDNIPALEMGGFVKTGTWLNHEILAGAKAGVYQLSCYGAEHEETLAGYGTYSYRYAGTDLSWKFSGYLDYFFSANLALGIELGYRWAAIHSVKTVIGSQTELKTNPDGSNFQLDYSGLFALGAVKFYFR